MLSTVDVYVTLQSSLSLNQSALWSLPTEQELVNLHNLHALTTLSDNTTQNAIKYLQTHSLQASLLSSLLNCQVNDNKFVWPTNDNNGNSGNNLEKVARFHRSGAGKMD